MIAEQLLTQHEDHDQQKEEGHDPQEMEGHVLRGCMQRLGTICLVSTKLKPPQPQPEGSHAL